MDIRFSQIRQLNFFSDHNLISLVNWFSRNRTKPSQSISTENPDSQEFSHSSICIWQLDREA